MQAQILVHSILSYYQSPHTISTCSSSFHIAMQKCRGFPWISLMFFRVWEVFLVLFSYLRVPEEGSYSISTTSPGENLKEETL